MELELGATLPEGTAVRVEAVKPARRSRRGIEPVFALDRLAVRTGVPDLAAEHDHYLYGSPKRGAQKPKRRKRKK